MSVRIAKGAGARLASLLDGVDAPPSCTVVVHDPPLTDALARLAELGGDRGIPSGPVVVVAESPDGAFRRAALRAGAMAVLDRDELDASALQAAMDEATDRFVVLERATGHSEARLRRIFETNLLGIIYWDVDGGVHGANDEFLRIVGYTREDLENGAIDWARMTTPEHREQDERAVEELRRTGKHAPIEKEYYRKDGSRIWVLVGSTFTAGSKGVGFVLDISRQKATEAALRESERAAHTALGRAEHERALLDTILDAAPAAIIVADADGHLVRFNPANELLWGPAPFSESVDEYREWKGWWADDSPRRGRRLDPDEWAMARALKGETVRGDYVEVEPFGYPGVRHTMINTGAPVRDAEGKIVGAIVAQMDISALVAAKNALRDSEAKFRDLADNIAQLAWMADETGSIFWYNRRWFEFTGTKLEDMEGWGWQTVHDPEHLDRVKEKFRDHLVSGEPWEDTFPMRRHDGVYRWFLSRAVPIRDEGGRVVRWFGTNTDVTEQRAAEEAARASQQLLHTTMDNFPTAILFKDRDGRFLDVNRAVESMFGVTNEGIRGKSMYELLPKETADVLRQHDVQVMESRRAMQFEETSPRPDGTRYYIDTNFPLVDTEGNVYGTGHIAHDVTQAKVAETEMRFLNERLREADRRKDQFIAILAHELRNPLAPVKNAVELLRRGRPELVPRVSEVIGRNVTHMARLIDDLLDVSRVARGKLVLQREVCDLAAITRQTAEDNRPGFDAAGLVLTVSTPDAPVRVEGDPVRLAQIVANLLHNATRFTPRGGRVEVRATADGTVSVKDTGIGIEPDLLSRLFDPFSQADQDLARTKGGLGLGLALAKGLAELHGGCVTADSAGAGLGATFTLHMPVVPAEPAATSRHATRPGGSRPLRVLLVEDNVDAAETMAELLEMSGHDVKVTADGVSGVAAARELRPDAVISDIGLPGALDGYALAQTIRSDPDLSNIYLVALSGYASEEARRRAQDAGFDVHFAKPPDLPRLEKALASVRRR